MPAWKDPVVTDGGNRPAELSKSTVEILLVGWRKAPVPPVSEPGRWQLAFMSRDEQRALWLRHRDWLTAEAKHRGIAEPWAARNLR
jgi:hypothetical protein